MKRILCVFVVFVNSNPSTSPHKVYKGYLSALFCPFYTEFVMACHWVVNPSSFRDKFPQNTPTSFYCLVPDQTTWDVAVESVYIPSRQESVQSVSICMDMAQPNTYVTKNVLVSAIKTVLLSHDKEYRKVFQLTDYVPVDCTRTNTVHFTLVNEHGLPLKINRDPCILLHMNRRL